MTFTVAATKQGEAISVSREDVREAIVAATELLGQGCQNVRVLDPDGREWASGTFSQLFREYGYGHADEPSRRG
jgi:hypothetical protein